jgi:hypothetical protein
MCADISRGILLEQVLVTLRTRSGMFSLRDSDMIERNMIDMQE